MNSSDCNGAYNATTGGSRRRPTFMARPAGIAGVPQGLEYRGGTTSGIPGMPQGLEYLTQVDQILVHQQVEIFEGWSTLPSYVN